MFELILRKTVSTCQSHREEIDPSPKGDVLSQNGGSSRARGVKKYQEMSTARGSEREKGVRSEKRNGKILLCIGTCIRVGTKFRSALHRTRRGGGGGDDGGSVSTGSGPPPTLDSPLSLFRRFVLPLFTSHPRARHIPLFSFVSLLFASRSLYLQRLFSL